MPLFVKMNFMSSFSGTDRSFKDSAALGSVEKDALAAALGCWNSDKKRMGAVLKHTCFKC